MFRVSDVILRQPFPCGGFIAVKQLPLRAVGGQVRQEILGGFPRKRGQGVHYFSGFFKAPHLPEDTVLEDHHADTPVRLVLRPDQAQDLRILCKRGFEPAALINKRRQNAGPQIHPLRAEQRRVGVVDLIQYFRIQRDLRVVPVAAVHIGEVVGKGGDAGGKSRLGIAFQNPAEQLEQRDLGFQRFPVVHMESQHCKFHKLIARFGDARQVYDNGVHVLRVFFKTAGEVVIPGVQDVQHRRFAGGAFRQRILEKAMEEIRVIGHAVFVAPKQKEE